MKYTQFLEASNKLKKFIKEQEKLNDVLKVISPTSTAVVEFGNEFIDDYIQIVEIALEDYSNSFSWFVFENDFGKNKLKVKINDNEHVISNEQQFFEICIKKTHIQKKHNNTSDHLHKCTKCDNLTFGNGKYLREGMELDCNHCKYKL